MTSHGVKVATRNLAEMKSKEADLRAAAAKEAVMEADCELTRQWNQLKAKADLVRKASEEADEEARAWGNKLFHAEEELEESQRLSEEGNLEGHMTPQDMVNSQFARDWGPTLLSEIESILEEPEFAGHLKVEQRRREGEDAYCHVWKNDKTKGFIIEKHSKGSADVGLLTSSHINGRGNLLQGWLDGSAMDWSVNFGTCKTAKDKLQRMQFDLRGKNKEVLRDLLRKVIE